MVTAPVDSDFFVRYHHFFGGPSEMPSPVPFCQRIWAMSPIHRKVNNPSKTKWWFQSSIFVQWIICGWIWVMSPIHRKVVFST